MLKVMTEPVPFCFYFVWNIVVAVDGLYFCRNIFINRNYNFRTTVMVYFSCLWHRNWPKVHTFYITILQLHNFFEKCKFYSLLHRNLSKKIIWYSFFSLQNDFNNIYYFFNLFNFIVLVFLKTVCAVFKIVFLMSTSNIIVYFFNPFQSYFCVDQKRLPIQ